jgi:hypothetical protein
LLFGRGILKVLEVKANEASGVNDARIGIAVPKSQVKSNFPAAAMTAKAVDPASPLKRIWRWIKSFFE